LSLLREHDLLSVAEFAVFALHLFHFVLALLVVFKIVASGVVLVDVVNFLLIPQFLLLSCQTEVDLSGYLEFGIVEDKVRLCDGTLHPACSLYVSSVADVLLVCLDESILVVSELLQLPLVGVVVEIVKLEIRILRELVLDDPLVDLLPVVLFRKGLLDISVSLLLSLRQNRWLYHLEVPINNLLDVVDPSKEQSIVLLDILLDDVAHVAQLQEVLPDLVDPLSLRGVATSLLGLRALKVSLGRVVDVEEGLEVLVFFHRALKQLVQGDHIQLVEEVGTVVGPLKTGLDYFRLVGLQGY